MEQSRVPCRPDPVPKERASDTRRTTASEIRRVAPRTVLAQHVHRVAVLAMLGGDPGARAADALGLEALACEPVHADAGVEVVAVAEVLLAGLELDRLLRDRAEVMQQRVADGADRDAISKAADEKLDVLATAEAAVGVGKADRFEHLAADCEADAMEPAAADRSLHRLHERRTVRGEVVVER